MHFYKDFKFSIVVYISTTIFTLKTHSTLLKNGKLSCSVYMDIIFIMLHVNTTMHAYTIDYYCFCLCISGHKFHFFVDTIKHCR